MPVSDKHMTGVVQGERNCNRNHETNAKWHHSQNTSPSVNAF